MKEGVLGERKMEGKKGKKPEEKMEGGRLLLGNKGGKMRENEGELGSSGCGAMCGAKNEEEWEKSGSRL